MKRSWVALTPFISHFPSHIWALRYIQDKPNGIDPFTGFFDYVEWVKENVLVPKQ